MVNRGCGNSSHNNRYLRSLVWICLGRFPRLVMPWPEVKRERSLPCVSMAARSAVSACRAFDHPHRVVTYSLHKWWDEEPAQSRRR